MIPKDTINLQYIKGAFFRRFWYIILPFFVLSMATVLYCIKAPRVYKAQTLILAEPQRMPREYITSTVTIELADQLRTITQQINSRTRLEKIINQYDLYSDIRASRTMADAVETFRKNIEINVSHLGGRSGSGSFQITYMNVDPVKTRDVTNVIADLFIEDNLKLRQAQATSTTRFLDHEVEKMKEVLRQKEEQVREFKEKYMGLLPEQMENNYRILTQLQQQLDSTNITIQHTENRKLLVQTQLSGLETVQEASSREVGLLQLGHAADQTPTSLDELRQQLRSLKSRYSDKHPDVARLKDTIAKLEKEQEARTLDNDLESSDVAPRASEAQQLMVTQREGLLSQLELIDNEIGTLVRRKKEIAGQIARYQQRIEEGPKIELLFVDLRRDYSQASANYQSLLQRKSQAQLAENLEKTQQAEQLSVLDPANLPQKPFKPDSRKVLALGFMIALACGLGLAYVLEYLDQTFRSSKELESVVQLPVLVSVPVVSTKREVRWNLFKKAWTVGALVSMASVFFYALFHLWKMDPGALSALI